MVIAMLSFLCMPVLFSDSTGFYLISKKENLDQFLTFFSWIVKLFVLKL